MYRKVLFLSSMLLLAASHPCIAQESKDRAGLDCSEIFPPRDGSLPPMQGKIIDGRYHSPKNAFSCRAYDFGEGKYLTQDRLEDVFACIGFYNSFGSFKKAEMIMLPKIKKPLEEKDLRDVFESFGIGILKKVDNAQGIEILQEEMLEGDMFFVALSVKEMSVLRSPTGQYMSSTRGYLAFQEQNNIVLLSNQIATLPGKAHIPKNHIQKLKQEILEFRHSFEFHPRPSTEIPTEK